MRPLSHTDTEALVHLWNHTLGPAFPIDAALWTFCTWRTPGFIDADAAVVWQDKQPVACVVTKVWRLEPTVGFDPRVGHISALLVHPDHRGQGWGQRLLTWAEDRLRREGAETILLGRDLQPFFCGVPQVTGALPFFTRRGYSETGMVYDVYRDLRGYTSPLEAQAARARLGSRLDLRPATTNDVPAILTFLATEFPGRWHYEVASFVARGGPPHDIVVLRLDGQVQGFARIHSPGATHLAYSLNWRKAARPPAGGLGPIGVGQGTRGLGLGLALLDAGLTLLAERGGRGCVIDWTTLLDFYAKVGFTPWRVYHQASKPL